MVLSGNGGIANYDWIMKEVAKVIFQISGFVILLAFYGCYFAKMLVQRQKGIKTDQIGKGKVGFAKFIEITMKIATYLVLIVEIGSIVLNMNTYVTRKRFADISADIIVIENGSSEVWE